MSSLVIMVGLPCSGKTTIVNKEYLPKGYAIVSPDQIRISLHGRRFVATAESFVWGIVYVMVDSLLARGNNVVIDGCFNTNKRREPFYKYKPTYHIVTTSKELCIKRALAAHDEYIIPVIEKMSKESEPLGENEIFKMDGS